MCRKANKRGSVDLRKTFGEGIRRYIEFFGTYTFFFWGGGVVSGRELYIVLLITFFFTGEGEGVQYLYIYNTRAISGVSLYCLWEKGRGI